MYDKIAGSKFGTDVKESAWKALVEKWSPVKRDIEINDIESLKLAFNGIGKLFVKLSPGDSDVTFIGGFPTGSESLFRQGIELPTGDYTISISKTCFETKTIVVPIIAGDIIKLEIKLNRQRLIKNSIGMELVYVPPINFMMGSPVTETGRENDEYQHTVTLTKGFYLQATEVTQGQWQAVMGNAPSRFSSCGNSCPVEMVSWDDAQKFIRKLNSKEGTNIYRLPTEAEWEYAARAGSTMRFCFGDSDDRLSAFAWYSNNSGKKTHPVAQKKPNDWGLYDMHGNVYEWCQDWYGKNYQSNYSTDPAGLHRDFRVSRGGSWLNDAKYCRSADRNMYRVDYRDDFLGFRVVLSCEKETTRK